MLPETNYRTTTATEKIQDNYLSANKSKSNWLYLDWFIHIYIYIFIWTQFKSIDMKYKIANINSSPLNTQTHIVHVTIESMTYR